MPRRVFHPLVFLLAVIQPISALAASTEAPSPLISQRTPGERPLLMMVGVAHFDNPGRDVVNTKVDNVLTPKRQKEIIAVVDQLAKFHPSHVAVEWQATKQEKLDARYAAYRAGTYELTSDERDQLGLRLAAKLQLPRVDAVDWLDEPPGKDEDYDFETYATAPDAKARLAALRDPKRGAKESAVLGRMTMGGFLAYLNSPEHFQVVEPEKEEPLMQPTPSPPQIHHHHPSSVHTSPSSTLDTPSPCGYLLIVQASRDQPDGVPDMPTGNSIFKEGEFINSLLYFLHRHEFKGWNLC